LALARGVQIVLIDETEGRREAGRRRLRVTGTLGILELGAARGMLDLPSTLAKLSATNFRVRDDLIKGLLERDAARRRKP
jgi:predicted nucleic acid-binding protein